MALLAAFGILDNQIILHAGDGNHIGWDNSPNVMDNGKAYIGNGWTIRIQSPSSKKRGKIVCNWQRAYKGSVYSQHQEYTLRDGTIRIETIDQIEEDDYGIESAYVAESGAYGNLPLDDYEIEEELYDVFSDDYSVLEQYAYGTTESFFEVQSVSFTPTKRKLIKPKVFDNDAVNYLMEGFGIEVRTR